MSGGRREAKLGRWRTEKMKADHYSFAVSLQLSNKKLKRFRGE